MSFSVREKSINLSPPGLSVGWQRSWRRLQRQCGVHWRPGAPHEWRRVPGCLQVWLFIWATQARFHCRNFWVILGGRGACVSTAGISPERPFTGTLRGTQLKRSVSLADMVSPLVHSIIASESHSLIALYMNTQIRYGYTAIINCHDPVVETWPLRRKVPAPSIY